ncbi:hypothetical protein QBC45DRAFT_10536 [Copromyces sp. CBS 386.78]|nr:hypothetical protein QBC45DRAFT_10536 [Copromyces sp. CBS 386.78]
MVCTLLELRMPRPPSIGARTGPSRRSLDPDATFFKLRKTHPCHRPSPPSIIRCLFGLSPCLFVYLPCSTHLCIKPTLSTGILPSPFSAAINIPSITRSHCFSLVFFSPCAQVSLLSVLELQWAINQLLNPLAFFTPDPSVSPLSAPNISFFLAILSPLVDARKQENTRLLLTDAHPLNVDSGGFKTSGQDKNQQHATMSR